MALYAQKANIVTLIPEERIDEFIAKGYRVMDATGHIIKDTAPDNLGDLKEAYINNTAEINRLTAEVARLKDELSRAQKILEAKEKEPKAVSTASEETSVPKATRKPRATKKVVTEE